MINKRWVPGALALTLVVSTQAAFAERECDHDLDGKSINLRVLGAPKAYVDDVAQDPRHARVLSAMSRVFDTLGRGGFGVLGYQMRRQVPRPPTNFDEIAANPFFLAHPAWVDASVLHNYGVLRATLSRTSLSDLDVAVLATMLKGHPRAPVASPFSLGPEHHDAMIGRVKAVTDRRVWNDVLLTMATSVWREIRVVHRSAGRKIAEYAPPERAAITRIVKKLKTRESLDNEDARVALHFLDHVLRQLLARAHNLGVIDLDRLGPTYNREMTLAVLDHLFNQNPDDPEYHGASVIDLYDQVYFGTPQSREDETFALAVKNARQMLREMRVIGRSESTIELDAAPVEPLRPIDQDFFPRVVSTRGPKTRPASPEPLLPSALPLLIGVDVTPDLPYACVRGDLCRKLSFTGDVANFLNARDEERRRVLGALIHGSSELKRLRPERRRRPAVYEIAVDDDHLALVLAHQGEWQVKEIVRPRDVRRTLREL